MKQHILYFDVLRVLAIFAVIILHVAAYIFNNANIASFTWQIGNFWDSLVRWGVPLFVMISGALFLDPKREITFNKLYSKNISRILFILILWSVFYASISFFYGEHKGDIIRLFVNIVLGHFHLWFLYMLLGLYMLVPLLRPICKDIKLVKYFLILSFLFTFLPTTVIKVLTGINLITSSAIISRILQAIDIFFKDKMYFYFTLGYVSYFILGLYINQINLKSWQRKVIYGLGFLGVLFTIFFSSYINLRSNILFSGIYSSLTLNILFEVLAVFVFIKYNINYIPVKIMNAFTYLSKYILGIYLIHPLIQTLLKKFLNLTGFSFNSMFSIPIIALLIFILSYLVSVILKKLKLY